MARTTITRLRTKASQDRSELDRLTAKPRKGSRPSTETVRTDGRWDDHHN